MLKKNLKSNIIKKNETLIQIVSNTLDELYIELLNIKIKKLEYDLYIKMKKEPLKLFKKHHKNWENEISNINNKLYDSYNELGLVIKK